MPTLNHRPVLLNEVLAALQAREDGLYIDGTFGRGGHAAAILQQLGPEGRLLAVDQDPAAVAEAERRFGGDERFEIVRGSFTQLRELAGERNWIGRVDGILLDLGVSSPQLDDPERGFSFRQEGPLDMRMDPERGPSAAEWLAAVSEDELVRVLREYGEERYARRIARAVLERRAEQPITTTRELASLIAEAIPRRERHKDPATRSFQAIRIAVNRELEAVDTVLPQLVELLAPGGRMAIISFHSLEDRRVKRFIRDEVRGGDYSPDLPLPLDAVQPRLRAVGKAVRAGKAELADNPRARSAVLRVAERLA